MAVNKSLTILLGAKNTASPVLDTVRKTVSSLGASMRNVGQKIGAGFVSSFKAIGSVAGSVIRSLVSLKSAFIGLLAAAGLGFGFKSAIQAMIQQQDAIEKLRAALKLLVGEAQADVEIKSLDKFASSIQQITKIGDDAVLELAKLGVTIGGFSGEGLKTATVAAIGLSEKLNIELEPAMQLIAKAAQGNTATLGKYGLVVDANATAQEKLNFLIREGVKAFDISKAAAQTTGGQLTQLKNTFGELLESVGFALEPAVRGVTNWLKSLSLVVQERMPQIVGIVQAAWGKVVEVFRKAIDIVTPIVAKLADVWATYVLPIGVAAKNFAVAVISAFASIGNSIVDFVSWFGINAKTIGDLFATLRDGIIAGFAVLEFTFRNWRELIELALLKASLSIVRFSNEVQYVFTDVIPSLLRWFSENWREIFQTLYDFTSTIFQNLGENIVSVIANLPELVTGKLDWSSVWKPLTDGFEATVKELPEIVARQKGDLESALETMVQEMDDRLGKDLQDTITNRMNEALNSTGSVKGFWQRMKDGIAGFAADFSTAIARASGSFVLPGTMPTARDKATPDNDTVARREREINPLSVPNAQSRYLVGITATERHQEQELREAKTTNKLLTDVIRVLSNPPKPTTKTGSY